MKIIYQSIIIWRWYLWCLLSFPVLCK